MVKVTFYKKSSTGKMNCDYVCPPWFIFLIVDECGEKLSEDMCHIT